MSLLKKPDPSASVSSIEEDITAPKPLSVSEKCEAHGVFLLGLSSGQGNPVIFHTPSQSVITLTAQKASMYRLGEVILGATGGRKYSEKGQDLGPDYDESYLRIQEQCSKLGPVIFERLRGPGIWLENGRPYYHTGKAFVRHGGHTYISDPRGFITPAPGNLLEMAQHFWVEISQAYGDDTATAILGFIVSSLAGASIPWRSHLWITGPRGTGKSTIWKIMREVYGEYSVSLDGRSSAAGIRQQVKSSTRPVLLDEAEPGEMRGEGKGVLALARSSSSGSEIFLGTPSGDSVTYCLHSSFCFASINPADLNAADASRFHVVNLKRRAGGRIPRFGKGFLHTFGQVILQSIINRYDEFTGAIEKAKESLVGEEERLKDTVGTLIGSAGFAMPKLLEVETMKYDKEAFKEDDARILLEKILSARIETDLTVSQSVLGEDRVESAEALGVKRVRSEKHGDYIFVSAKNDALKTLAKLFGSYVSVLKRLPGAQERTAKLAGRVVKGIGIPIEGNIQIDRMEDP